jgi:multiple sugar transport system substrate-binding protein
MSNKGSAVWLAILPTILVGAGCSSGDGALPAASEAKAKEPVTIRVFDVNRMTEEDFNNLVAEPVRKKYPYITVEYVPGEVKTLQNITIDTGNSMDLALYWNGIFSEFSKYDLLMDMRSLVKSHNVDLSRYQDNMLTPVTGTKGELYGLPFYNQGNALYYNKDLFDRFAMAYPKDGLFWEDIVELTKKLYRTENGVTYYGYNYESEYRLQAPLSLGIVNESAGKAIVNNEQWAKVFTMLKTLRRDVQGGGKRGTFIQEFSKNRTAAMGGSVTSLLTTFKGLGQEGLNWDIAQFPSWKERPNISSFADLGVAGILKTSKHPEEAMLVAGMFVSDEVQLNLVSKAALVSPLKGQIFSDQFAKSIPELQDKRLTSIFKSKSAPFPEYGLGERFTEARGKLRNHMNKMFDGTEDVNTALRNAEEEINSLLRQGK